MTSRVLYLSSFIKEAASFLMTVSLGNITIGLGSISLHLSIVHQKYHSHFLLFSYPMYGKIITGFELMLLLGCFTMSFLGSTITLSLVLLPTAYEHHMPYLLKCQKS